MLRFRFHGRGGHGVKTASRIVGTAAFLTGYQAQDSPIYGAERRGAPVVSFTRVAKSPILERGAIDFPDFILVGDETLLGDAKELVLTGQEAAAVVFVNSENEPRQFQALGIQGAVVTFDLTSLTREVIGRSSALSAGLAAAAARLCGEIEFEALSEALRPEP